jgi:hypothetical protein
MNTIKKIILPLFIAFPLLVFAHNDTPFGNENHNTPFGSKSETENYTPFGESRNDNGTAPFARSAETRSASLRGVDDCPMCGNPIANFVDGVCQVCGYETGNGDGLSAVPLDNGIYVLLALIAMYGVCQILRLRLKREARR